MPLHDKIPESHVMAAAAAEESTVEILKSAHPKPEQLENPMQPAKSTFIEDVDQWIRKYLRLADEVLESPAEPEADDKKSAA
jgi:DNA-binding protein H-NS